MIKVRTEIEIDAPASAVWKILTDFESYGEWNPFIRQIDGELAVGQKLQVKLGNPSKPEEAGFGFRPEVTRFEEGARFHWLGTTIVRGVMDGEHIFALEPIDDSTTRFVHGEDYKGLLVTLFGRFVPDDGHPNYHAMNQALKKVAEQQTK